MAKTPRTIVVANPQSGGGALARRWGQVADQIRSAFGPFEHRFTEGPGHATQLAKAALLAGYDQVVALGGDGTIGQVAAGFMEGDRPINREAVLGVLPHGTGGDFRRTLRISKDLRRSASALRGTKTAPLDLGRIRYTAHDGSPAEGYFVNIASFGMGGLVDRFVNESGKRLGGTLSFLASTVRAATMYRNASVELRLDGEEPFQMKVVNVAVANGQFFGGGMRVAPWARTDDGQLDVIAIGDFSPSEMLRFGYRIYLGTHLGHPKVRPGRGRHLEARPLREGAEILLDVDGEAPGRLPATFDVLPGALNLKVPD
ncbi:MAG: diacylglycerol kinase family lipid kinase [Polyangia bacterium]|jgi:YegS/Rv2252/BmrU family lipid kinase|nr:diacylglycerol kinase family lipid kinase [Polyangia bacterium]